MAEQPETTRLEWERTGPFVPFEVARSRTQHIPEEYLKNAHWGIVDGDESYHVKSLVEGDEHWYPVCYARTGRSSRREVSLSGVGSGSSALATYDADMW